jgi:hypothetical protein
MEWFEQLESRWLLSASLSAGHTLSVGGTSGNDVITFARKKGWLTVDVNGSTYMVAIRAVRRIYIGAGEGNDRVVIGPRAIPSQIFGDGGDDTLWGSAASDTIDGGAGNDSIAGGAGADQLVGAAGNDRLAGGRGNDTIDGGAGIDTWVREILGDDDTAADLIEITDDRLVRKLRHKLVADEVVMEPVRATGDGIGVDVAVDLRFDFPTNKYGVRLLKLSRRKQMITATFVSPLEKQSAPATAGENVPITLNLGHLTPGGRYTLKLVEPDFSPIGGQYVFLSQDLAVPKIDARGSPPPLPGNWRLTFRDEFSGESLNPLWHTAQWWDRDHTVVGDDELQAYDASGVTVSDGALHLTARREKKYGMSYVSGLVMTGGSRELPHHPKFNFLYGYSEVRAKLPAGQGLWPAIWMMPASYNDDNGELDVLETFGTDPTAHFTVHRNGRQDGQEWSGPDFSQGFHTFAVDWQPDHVAWYVDGVERGRTTNRSLICPEAMYPILNLAVSAQAGGLPNADAGFPAHMDVDYIRIWQKG